MKTLFAIAAITCCLITVTLQNVSGKEGAMEISSTAFASGAKIPKEYTCDGRDISPPLDITSVPANAKSLALIVDDPDAPMGTWDHWIMWNIDPYTRRIEKGSVPPGAIQGYNSFKRTSYGGPCPPSGSHRYFFKLYALDTTLNLPPDRTKADLERAMKGHIIQQAEVVGKYR